LGLECRPSTIKRVVWFSTTQWTETIIWREHWRRGLISNTISLFRCVLFSVQSYDTIFKLCASLSYPLPKTLAKPIGILSVLLVLTVDLTMLSLTWSALYWMIGWLGGTYLQKTQKEVAVVLFEALFRNLYAAKLSCLHN